jgi:basic membrane lipoprotein Med (substrate-binding protein (PBP1-ABC) superfamily)
VISVAEIEGTHQLDRSGEDPAGDSVGRGVTVMLRDARLAHPRHDPAGLLSGDQSGDGAVDVLHWAGTTDQRQTVVTSILKNAGNALYLAAKANTAGTLAYGKPAAVGLAEDGVGYVDNANFDKLVPAAVRAELKAQAAKVKSGAVKVPSAF